MRPGPAEGSARMTDLEHTWLVECFAPGIDDAAVAAAADRVRTAVAERSALEARVDYLGALLMAEDEVVFHAFQAADVDVVRDVSVAAGLRFERVIASVGVVPGLPVPAGAGRPIPTTAEEGLVP